MTTIDPERILELRSIGEHNMRTPTVLFIMIPCLCGCGAMNTLDAGFANLDAAVNGITVLGPRDRIHVGMTLTEVWQVYGLDLEKASRIDPIHEETNGPALWRTYHYWLRHGQYPRLFALTFESHKLPNYDEAQQILRKRREEVYQANPGLRERVDAISEDSGFVTEDGRDLVLAALGFTIFDESTICATDFTLVRIAEAGSSAEQHPTPPASIESDVYGPGIHRNEYGQPVTVRPDFGGVPGERLELKQDAYGPGIHADQYGRPVR